MKIERDNLTCLGNSRTKIRGTWPSKRDFSLHYPVNAFDVYNEIVFEGKYPPADTYTPMHDMNEWRRFESWTKNEVIEYTVRLLRLYNETKGETNE